VVLVGAAAVDVAARAAPGGGGDPQGSTAPGRVTFTPGGVARNVAECLRRLDPRGRAAARPLLVAAVGDDAPGRFVLQGLDALGLPARGVAVVPGGRTGIVAFVLDARGGLLGGVADLGAAQGAASLGAAGVRAHRRAIAGAGTVCLDANLGAEALAEAVGLAAAAGVPAWFEPVSRAKALAGVAFLGRLAFASPNEAEAIAMACAADGQRAPALRRLAEGAGDAPVPLEVLAAAAEILVQRGLGCAVVTLGPRGVLWARREGGFAGGAVEVHRMAALPAAAGDVVSVSGAGDALVAGALLRLQAGDGVAEALAFGQAAARQAVETARSVPERFDVARLTADARAALASRARLRPADLRPDSGRPPPPAPRPP